MKSPTEAEFLQNVENHQMEVIRDDGVNRHIRFKRPNTSNQYFDLITWPGSLCYTGDMGTYVFSRLSDMFEFFCDSSADGLRINPQYWAEKLQAADRSSGGAADEYSPERFQERVNQWLDDMEASDDLRQAAADRVLRHADDGEFLAMQAAMEFEHDGERLVDFWEARCREYTHYFIWCCYALVWGIRQYDGHSRNQHGEAGGLSSDRTRAGFRLDLN